MAWPRMITLTVALALMGARPSCSSSQITPVSIPALPDSADSTLPPSIQTTKLAIVGGTILSAMVAIHIYQQNGWWKDNRRSFHVREDLSYGLSVDKIGHFYGASVITFTVSKAVEWANVPPSRALWYGAGASVLFQTFLEIEDGFSAWGFDRVDFASNLGGAMWPVLQYYAPAFRTVDVKMSYRPSELLNKTGGSGFRGQKHLVMDDYEGQTFWLSGKVNDYLPNSLERYWPDFLCLAVGYGARDIAVSGRSAYSVVYLALDVDMTRILPQDTWFLRTLSSALNFIHVPAPAVRISPSPIWYGLYF